MELGEFLKEPLAPILRENFVEARLHTDTKKSLKARILELQDTIGGGGGLPTYVVVDAETGERKGIYGGIPIDDEELQDYVDFLNEGLAAARGKAVSAH